MPTRYEMAMRLKDRAVLFLKTNRKMVLIALLSIWVILAIQLAMPRGLPKAPLKVPAADTTAPTPRKGASKPPARVVEPAAPAWQRPQIESSQH